MTRILQRGRGCEGLSLDMFDDFGIPLHLVYTHARGTYSQHLHLCASASLQHRQVGGRDNSAALRLRAGVRGDSTRLVVHRVEVASGRCRGVERRLPPGLRNAFHEDYR